MNLFIFLPTLLVFIYYFYKQVKDDYFFIRKNFSSDQMLDIAFIIVLISLLFSRLFFIIFHPVISANIITSFFSLEANKFSLVGLLIGGIAGIYFIAKYKRLPLGRMFDLFSTAFIVSLPIGFLTLMIFVKEYILFLFFCNAIIYSFLAFVFIRYFNSKSSVFFLFFPPVFLINSLIYQFLTRNEFLNGENAIIVLLFFAGLFFYFKRK